MPRGLMPFVVRRVAAAAALIVIVSSAAMVLARLAPGDHLSDFNLDPAAAAAECERIRCRDPLLQQYLAWVARAVRLDLGESLRYRRPVRQLVAERAANSASLGFWALCAATAIGIPAGVLTGTRGHSSAAGALRASSTLLLSLPPLVSALTLLLVAARTGWFPVGGMAPAGSTAGERMIHYVLPVLALALPIAATLERLQSRAIGDALSERCILAASARGVPRGRIVWRHAWPLSLRPVLAIYGIVVGALISGSFAVEYLMGWPGLGALMFEALVARDAYLVAGCAAAGAIALAAGILASDLALAALDPRALEGT